MSPLAGALVTAADTTAGVVALAPFTLWAEALAMAWPPKPSAAVAPAVLAIVPPFSPSALAPTLIPSASTSADWTT